MIKPKLLIVEDEKAILRGLVDLFVFHGFDVDSEQDGAMGLARALAGKYDCILLDVMLPSMNGFDICNEIRKHSRSQPIVMLTAKSTEQDVINGLTMGADDYIAKPFSIQELVLRVTSFLRRNGWSDDKSSINLCDELILDIAKLQLNVRGSLVDVTRREADILKYLHQQEEPVSRQRLLSDVWGYKSPDGLDTRTVDIHVAKLRKKIEREPKKPNLLITCRGEGYRLNA